MVVASTATQSTPDVGRHDSEQHGRHKRLDQDAVGGGPQTRVMLWPLASSKATVAIRSTRPTGRWSR